MIQPPRWDGAGLRRNSLLTPDSLTIGLVSRGWHWQWPWPWPWHWHCTHAELSVCQSVSLVGLVSLSDCGRRVDRSLLLLLLQCFSKSSTSSTSQRRLSQTEDFLSSTSGERDRGLSTRPCPGVERARQTTLLFQSSKVPLRQERR